MSYSNPTTCEIQPPLRRPLQPDPCPSDRPSSELQSDLNETRELIEQLYGRLGPVLMPNALAQQGAGLAIPVCELKAQILGCNDRLREILARLQV